MRLYRLNVSPCESDGEGEDHDEWFSSLGAARRRRAELVRETPDGGYRYGEDYGIDEVHIHNLSPRKLALAILNRHGILSSREVVEAHRLPRRIAEDL